MERKWKRAMSQAAVLARRTPLLAAGYLILQRNRSNTERRNPKGACFQTEIYGMMALSGFAEGQFGLRLRKTVIYICSD